MATDTNGDELLDPPEVQKRLLRSILRQERERADLTQAEVAQRVLWSLSKLIRIETGVVPVAPSDARTLLLEYGASQERLSEVLELATQARRKSPWDDYRNVISPETRILAADEQAASSIWKYETSFVPGLMQTEAYGKSILKALLPDRDDLEQDIDRIWKFRRMRQGILDRKIPPDVHYIIGEAALSRPVGSSQIMRDQIQHLREMNTMSHVDLHLLPFRAGPHPGMDVSFTIVQFRDTRMNDLVYLENADRESTNRDDGEQAAIYKSRFCDLLEIASQYDFDREVENIQRRLFPGVEGELGG